ncbi:MAG: MAPEG family protein [Alphaproteobacteria bacterium]|nr:MAPEG family protein [Alphaproteobacteria bacterium]
MLSTPPTIFAFYAGLNGLILLFLAVLVTRARRKTLTSLGDGGHALLQRAIRAHGNAAEYIPVHLLLLLGLVLIPAEPGLLHAVGATGTVGRVLHGAALSLSSGPTIGRQVGIILTWGAMLAGSIALLIRAFP